MKTRGQFKSVGFRRVMGRRVEVKEHVQLDYYRIGSTNIPAHTVDEAIEKYERSASCRTAVTSGQPLPLFN